MGFARHGSWRWKPMSPPTPPATRTGVERRGTPRCSPARVRSTCSGSTRWSAPTWSRVPGRPCCCGRAFLRAPWKETRPDPVDCAATSGWGSRTMGSIPCAATGRTSRSDDDRAARTAFSRPRASASPAPWSDRYDTVSKGTRGSRDPDPSADLLQLRPLEAASARRRAEPAGGADRLLAVERVAAAATADDVDDLASPT
jgi:hypothetical protein